MVNLAILGAAAPGGGHPEDTGPDDRLPDSAHPWGRCPRCDRQCSFSQGHQQPVTWEYQGGFHVNSNPVVTTERVSTLMCQGCGQAVIVVEELTVGGKRPKLGEPIQGEHVWTGIYWWPMPGTQTSIPDVPVAVAEAVAEGARCLAVNAPRAAAVLFRGALALIVDDKGSAAAKGMKNLYAQLKQMADDHALTPALADVADHVRLIGNAGAHPTELDPVTVEEAADLAEFIEHLLQYLYVMPARVMRSRARRNGSV